MPWHLPSRLLALGLLVAVAGFAYDLAFAGIPYPDPTPDIATQYRFHSRIAALMGRAGAAVFLLGLLVLVFLGLRKAWRRANS